MTRHGLIALLTLIGTLGAVEAQPADSLRAEAGVLRVEAQAGVVWIDGEEIGPAPREVARAAGPHHVELRERAPQQWAPLHRDTTVSVIANAITHVRLALPIRYRIETVPPGADAVLVTMDGEEPLGRTPVEYEAASPMSATVVLRKTGFLPYERTLPEGVGRLAVYAELQPALAADAETGVEPWRPEARPNYYLDAGIGVATVAAAALAIHFKFEADRLDDRGDPTLRDRIERNDTYALVALGAMQVGVGVLALRWVLR